MAKRNGKTQAATATVAPAQSRATAHEPEPESNYEMTMDYLKDEADRQEAEAELADFDDPGGDLRRDRDAAVEAHYADERAAANGVPVGRERGTDTGEVILEVDPAYILLDPDLQELREWEHVTSAQQMSIPQLARSIAEHG